MTEYEQERIIAGIQWDTTPDQGEYRKNLCNLVMEVTDAHYNYEMKLREISSEIIPELPPISGSLKQKDLRSWVNIYENTFIVNYYRDEIGLAFQPCAIMDDRPLKRCANGNDNLDTHYGYHKDKKVCILPTSKDLENSLSTRTI
ncbi:hypothetical protein RhiirC2_803773 [Rhizophagus irregularis]|uniref:Uncharacterized protein n=1 Tax=Rhizophagus irregularis TaxID=588596 RepID=A0A2N1LB91_9GLOM|nr:hypothetical protein RhiirC2_803773 [Rhizophagus irregularis]